MTWSGTVSGSIGRTYDSDFRLTSTTVNSGNAVTYQYDADGLVTKAGDLTITRSTQHGLITATAVGQVTDTRSYNSFGELAAYTAMVGATPVLSESYTRDSLGRITQKNETIEGQQTTYHYGYDTAGRLVQVVKTPQGQPALTTTYAYDANGNRLSKADPGGTTSGTYDAQDRLLTYGSTNYTYNASGDLTSKTQNNTTITYDYDVFGNLRKVVLDNGQVIEYVIDGRNRRVGKKIDGVLVQGFLFDGQLRPTAELDGNNQVVATFIYGTHVNIPELIVKGGTTYRIIHDHLGSPRLVIDQSTGAAAQRLDYDESQVPGTYLADL